MAKCGLCGGEAPRQPCITTDGRCDLCGKKAVLAEDKPVSEKEAAATRNKD